MSDEQVQLKQVKAVFEQAIDYASAEDRMAYLERACAGRPDIRRQVDRLLAAHDREDDFMERSPAEDLVDCSLISHEEALEWLPDDRVIDGRYRVLSVLAIGGMGVVYKAEQLSPHRPVALKVMRRGMMTRRMQRRFHYEAETLAQLIHPNVAQVIDAGVHYRTQTSHGPEALRYFAMEYVENALPITDYARQHDLPTTDRLRVFSDACAAIQHGHQRGIIHRDIKPANVLVDAEGRVKVIDFGVARATGSDVAISSMQTAIGEIVGTVQYMSPEQCSGNPNDIDTRSDVYSLGLLLYELLTDILPYDVNGLSVARAMKVVEESEPARLSSINRHLRGDLEVITNKSLTKDPNRRYQSVSELAEDIRRYRNGQPICACKPSVWLRITSWMGSHPWWTAMTGAMTTSLSLLIAATGVVWYVLFQPHHFESAGNNGTAQLVTRMGRTLAVLGDAAAGVDNVEARMIERSSFFGSDRRAAFLVHVGTMSTDSQLWVCDPHDLDTPLWQTHAQPESDLPPIPPEVGVVHTLEAPLIVSKWLVADVFPEVDGQEILVIQEEHGSSPNLVSVYSLDGDILFDLWHLGHIGNVFWWNETGLLICTGERHGVPDVSRYGFDQGLWPRVVFAVRPQLGTRLRWVNAADWPGVSAAELANVTKSVIWYNTLMPQQYAYTYSHNGITRPRGTGWTATTVELTFQSQGIEAFVLHVSAAGTVIKFAANDEFIRRYGENLSEQPTLKDWPQTITIPE